MASPEVIAQFERTKQLKAAAVTQLVVAHEVYLTTPQDERTGGPEDTEAYRTALVTLSVAEQQLNNLDLQLYN